MDLILDTCGLLSLAGIANRKLTEPCLSKIQTAETLYVSACSHFEISLKHKREQLDLGEFDSAMDFWKACVDRYDLTEAPVTGAFFHAAVCLPDHHADPFDRIIIATAQTLGCEVITYDEQFDRYDVGTIR